jgi:nitrous oxidase accessory protein NosD
MLASKTLRSALLAILPCVAAAPAFALVPDTFVSSAGTDAGACDSVAAACRSFAYAIGQTSPGGTMKAVNAGNFGPFKIEKSITVIGVEGAMVHQTGWGDGVTIAAGATDTVRLVGLDIVGNGSKAPAPGSNGVAVSAAGRVVIEKCLIRDFVLRGVTFTNNTSFLIQDTTLSNFGLDGVSVRGTATSVAIGAVHRVTVDGARTGGGVYADGLNHVSVSETVVVNSNWGFVAAGKSRLEITHSSARHNVIGLAHYSTAIAETAGNNFFRDNGTNISGPAPTFVGMQ